MSEVNQKDPPYARIAGQIRHRIETGELAPGSRVPSTREIIAQWGVAMATATKVLAALRDQGLVRAVPGVGTVVADIAPAPAPPGRRPARAPVPRAAGGPAQPQHSGRIVAAAIEIADAEGLAALSMRRVATQAGVATMSLYRHVTDKDDLLVQMMDAVFGQFQLPADAAAGWRDRLELAARALWSMFRAHPWLAPAMSLTRPQLAPAALPYAEWVLGTLNRAGLDMATRFTAYLVFANYIRGTAVHLEAEAEAEAASGLSNDEYQDSQASVMESLLATGQFPELGQLVGADYDFDLEALFEFGLQRLLDGLAVLIEPRANG